MQTNRRVFDLFNIFNSAKRSDKIFATAGVGYVLPMLIETDLLIDHEAKLRLDIEKRFQWTSTLFSEAEVTLRQDRKSEFEISLMYGPSWAWSAGVMLTEDNVGIGLHYNF